MFKFSLVCDLELRQKLIWWSVFMVGKSGRKSESGARSPFHSKSAPESLRKSQRLISLISQNDQKSASSKCQNTASCVWKPIRRLSFQPAVNQGRQTIRGLWICSAEFPQVCAWKCWAFQLPGVSKALSWILGRGEGDGVGRREGEQLSAWRTATGASALPSLTAHISSKCAFDVASSNPNKKPGEKMTLWLALFSIPWNICRHGDPSPGFFFFFFNPAR